MYCRTSGRALKKKMGAPTVFTGCRSCFWWLPQSNKIAAAANLCGGRWGRQKEGFENFIIRCSLFLLRTDRRRNKEHTIQKFPKMPFCRPHPPPILKTEVLAQEVLPRYYPLRQAVPLHLPDHTRIPYGGLLSGHSSVQ